MWCSGPEVQNSSSWSSAGSGSSGLLCATSCQDVDTVPPTQNLIPRQMCCSSGQPWEQILCVCVIIVCHMGISALWDLDPFFLWVQGVFKGPLEYKRPPVLNYKKKKRKSSSWIMNLYLEYSGLLNKKKQCWKFKIISTLTLNSSVLGSGGIGSLILRF